MSICRVIEALHNSNRPRVNEIPLQLHRFWDEYAPAPRIIVTNSIINTEAPNTRWASTTNGINFYVRPRLAIFAPLTVLDGVIAHELAHAFLITIGRSPRNPAGLNANETHIVEADVEIQLQIWGMQTNSLQWLLAHMP